MHRQAHAEQSTRQAFAMEVDTSVCVNERKIQKQKLHWSCNYDTLSLILKLISWCANTAINYMFTRFRRQLQSQPAAQLLDKVDKGLQPTCQSLRTQDKAPPYRPLGLLSAARQHDPLRRLLDAQTKELTLRHGLSHYPM